MVVTPEHCPIHDLAEAEGLLLEALCVGFLNLMILMETRPFGRVGRILSGFLLFGLTSKVFVPFSTPLI